MNMTDQELFRKIEADDNSDLLAELQDKLNTELKEKAIAVGLCEQWQSEWNKNWTPKKMVDKYFEGINFCAENHYPDKDFIKQEHRSFHPRECNTALARS